MVTQTNLDRYLDSVRLYLGDQAEPYQHSDPLLLTALVEAVRFLASRWQSRYLIYSPTMLVSDDGTTKIVQTPFGNCSVPSSIQENDMFPNCYAQKTAGFMELADEAALILAASYLLRRAKLQSTSISNWTTPDLSFSNVESSRSVRDMLNADIAMLDLLFRKKLGSIQWSPFQANLIQHLNTLKHTV